MYLPYFIVFIEVTRPWRHGLFPGTRSPGSSVHFILLKAMLWHSQSLRWTHLSLLSDDGWSLAKCISVFMVTGVLTLMLHTAAIGSQPATIRRRCKSYYVQIFLSKENASKAWQLQRAVCKRNKTSSSSIRNWPLQTRSFSLPLVLVLT